MAEVGVSHGGRDVALVIGTHAVEHEVVGRTVHVGRGENLAQGTAQGGQACHVEGPKVELGLDVHPILPAVVITTGDFQGEALGVERRLHFPAMVQHVVVELREAEVRRLGALDHLRIGDLEVLIRGPLKGNVHLARDGGFRL